MNLKAGFLALLPSCRQAARLQSDALEQPLPVSKRLGLWVHLRICKWCRRYGEQICFLRRAGHEHIDEVTAAMPHTLSAEAKGRILEKLRE